MIGNIEIPAETDFKTAVKKIRDKVINMWQTK